jgi:hypothetical protein
LNPQSLVSIEQNLLIALGSIAAAAGIAAALGEDIETWIFRYGLLAALILSLALDLYYRRRYRPRKRSE